MDVPFLHLSRQFEFLRPRIEEAFREISSHHQWILGKEVTELETELAKTIGTKEAIGVASGTDALVLLLRSISIQRFGKEFFEKEDLIITPSFTFVATGEAILRAGATPVFLNVSPKTYNLNPEEVENFLLSPEGKKVVGIVVVHLFGLPADMDSFSFLKEKHGLFLIEDCAQAFGAEHQNKKVGSMGDGGAFSFFPTKNLSCFGDGGAVTTQDPTLGETVRILRNHGGKDKYNAHHIGYNSRLDTIQAGILLKKLPFVRQWNERRREIAKIYKNFLKDLPVIVPEEPQGSYHVYNQFTIQAPSFRDELRLFLKEKGVETMIYYPIPLHKMKVFFKNSLTPFSLEVTEKICSSVLSIPIDPFLKDEEVEYVGRTVRDGIKTFLEKKKAFK